MINFEKLRAGFHPVIKLPSSYDVYDFTQGYDPERTLKKTYGIGRYNEKRKSMYTTDLFAGATGVRNIHMGIDIAAPINTEIYSFINAEIYLFGYNEKSGDYGYTIITKQVLDETPLYALYGHLSEKSLKEKYAGQKISAGECIAWIGDKHENGGWNPHLHFQLSYEKPLVPDLPGVVDEKNHARALEIYPDPQLVLGKLY